MTLPLDHARRIWAHAQGLLTPSDDSLPEIVRRTGWIRTLGGAEAYLALRARRRGLTIDEVHRATSSGDLRVVPAVRGCIYLVPRDDVPLALAVSASLDRKRLDRDTAKAGVEPGELERVGEAVLRVLDTGPRTTRQLSGDLPEGVVRRLGDAGKKVGISSTLPPALRVLEWGGHIVRQQVDDRLDHERYRWARRAGTLPAPPEQPFVQLAHRYFAWAGPASIDGFVAWSGLGKRLARDVVQQADLQQVAVQDHEVLWTCEEPTVPEGTGRLTTLPGLDNLHALRLTSAALVHPSRRTLQVSRFGRGTTTLGEGTHIFERLLCRDGEIVGAMAWDPHTSSAEARAWNAPQRALSEELASVTRFLRDLGHGRAFSLDKDETLRKRRDLLRGWSNAGDDDTL